MATWAGIIIRKQGQIDMETSAARDFTSWAGGAKPGLRRAAGALGVAALLAFAAPALAEDGPTEAPYTYRAEVVKVVDGDTIDVHIDLGFYVWIRFQRIHLYGIAAPAPAEAAGVAATAHLESLIGGKMVILKSLRGEDPPDRQGSFNNWEGLVWLDGKSINDAMVESGNAVKAETP
jgi:micrococcal nuclease